nr:GPALPP motifs-containing protein 1 [Onthophagus taurus]
MHQFSDSDTPDSDDGRRFKTESTRPKKDVSERQYRRYRSPSPCRRNHPEKRRKSRSRSPNRYDRSKRRSDERYRDESRRYSRYDEDKDERKRRESKENSVNKDKRDSGEKDKNDSSNYTKRTDLIRKEDEGKKSYAQKDDSKKILNNENEMIEEKSYGPTLPSKKSNDFKESEITEKNDLKSYGPSLPQNLLNTKSDSEESYGPSLPPASSSKTQSEPTEKIIGPSLPEHLREKLAKASENVEINQNNENDIKSENEYDIKSDDDDDDNDEIIGPLPPNMLPTLSQIELEERALQIKINNLTAKTNETKREEWMMELPEVKAIGLGLGPRQFRANPRPDMSDRSSWTDTPKDKLNKQSSSNPERDLKKEAEYKEVKRRDEEQEKIIKKHKKSSKRDEKSLLEMHQSKMEKKKGEPVERRPFNREIDLKVNRFDEAQKKAILKKAQLLDDRFSSGQAKYL